MSNTTFDAKQAVKYMIDGHVIKNTLSNELYSLEGNYRISIDNLLNNGDVLELSTTIHSFLKTYENHNSFAMTGKELVEWYRPKEVWYENYSRPEGWGIDSDTCWWRSQEACVKFYGFTKVIEWETKLFPASWKECE